MKKSALVLLILLLLLPLCGCCLRHELVPADCTRPAFCIRCGAVGEGPHGHAWTEASCTAPKTCTVCGATEGSALEHSVASWVTVKEPTYTENGIETGICRICGETIERGVVLKVVLICVEQPENENFD